MQKTVCDKDGEEGRRGNVKKTPMATKVGKEKAADPARASTKSLKRFFDFCSGNCSNLLSRVSGAAKRFSA